MSGAAAARAALSRLAWLSSGLGLAGAAASACLYTVDGGQRAVVWHRFRGGIQTDVVGEGLHFRIPWVEVPTIFDVRLRPRIIATRTGTKDLQTVQISLRVLSRPDVAHLAAIYKDLGEDFDERVLPSIVSEVLKATVVRGRMARGAVAAAAARRMRASCARPAPLRPPRRRPRRPLPAPSRRRNSTPTSC
jgi:prohibitin 1